MAHDGAEAFDYLYGTGINPGRGPKDIPQLFLLDLKLPKIDGLEVLKRIRTDWTKFILVVIFTSSKEELDVVKGHKLGANSCLRKPVDFNQFAEAVKQLELYWLF